MWTECKKRPFFSDNQLSFALIYLFYLPCCACSCGGIVMMSSDGRILVRNTLEDRLKITYEANLPVIRQQLFDSEP